MGGTLSVLQWNMGYDPIVEGVAVACGVDDSTFVDDLGAHTRGPRHTVATELFLLCAAHAAGLLLDGHQCEWLTCTGLHPAAEAVLAALPVQVVRAGTLCTLRGLRPHFLAAVLARHAGPRWATTHAIHVTACRCGTKTAVVPQADLSAWQRALAHSPFGASSVVPHWPYLGVTVAACAPLASAPAGWAEPGLAMVQHGTWQRACARIADRVQAAVRVPGSAGQRARQWNTYMASVLPYPAQVCLPAAEARQHLERLLASMLPRQGGAPGWVLPAVGALFGIPGAPRCPTVSAQASAAVAWARSGGWGPAPANRAAARHWAAARRRARLPAPTGPWPAPAAWQTDAARLQHAGLGGDGHVPRSHLRLCGPATYRLLAYCRYEGRLDAWLRRRSAQRRWLPTGGNEWRLLGCARDFTAGFHLFRLLAGGLRGTSGARDTATRREFPRTCAVCGAAPVAHAWHAPAPGAPGLGWCAVCAGDALLRHGGSALLLDPPAATARAYPATPPDWRAGGAYSCCPLCGMGDGGSEHLLTWCPAVASAWQRLRPGGHSIPQMLRAEPPHPQLASLLHQASFLHCSLRTAPHHVGTCC